MGDPAESTTTKKRIQQKVRYRGNQLPVTDSSSATHKSQFHWNQWQQQHHHHGQQECIYAQTFLYTKTPVSFLLFLLSHRKKFSACLLLRRNFQCSEVTSSNSSGMRASIVFKHLFSFLDTLCPAASLKLPIM